MEFHSPAPGDQGSLGSGHLPATGSTHAKLLMNKKWILWLVCLLLVAWVGGGCTSLEARAKGVEKPFPGIRYLKDPRHSVYGEDRFLNSARPVQEPNEPEELMMAGCVWIEALDIWVNLPSGEVEPALKGAFILMYWPVDFTATLGLDVALWPFDALDHYAHGRNEAAPGGDADIIE